MTKTQNYELNIVEGTDKVNPLVVDNPNYSKIDEVMKKNADSSITTATELKTGTVHTLTRVNKDCPVFRFVATSEYTSGDTFTVDGTQVTALLTDGTPLVSGCYIIGANVLCCLTGTSLSIYVAQNLSGVTASDSEKLGGQLPSYYGSASSVATAQETAENANQLTLALSKELTFNEHEVTQGSQVISGSYNLNTYGHVAQIRAVDLKLNLISGRNYGVLTFDSEYSPQSRVEFLSTVYSNNNYYPCVVTVSGDSVNLTALNWNGGQQSVTDAFISFSVAWLI